MECAEIRTGFVAGRVPAGPEVDAHLQQCGPCRDLFLQGAQLGRQLASSVDPAPPAGELFALVEGDLKRELGLRAALRALPTAARVAALLGVAGVLFGFQLLLRRRPDFEDYSPSVFWSIALALVAVLVAGAHSATRGPTASLRAQRLGLWSAAALLALPALAALLAPFGAGSPAALAAWASPASCFSYGAAFVLPIVLLCWLFERRDQVPASGLLAVGALAGIAANLLLHAHCGSAHWGHLLVGHASVGVVWALVLRAVFALRQAR